MRISDWSSDVCSSDLENERRPRPARSRHLWRRAQLPPDGGPYRAVLIAAKTVSKGRPAARVAGLFLCGARSGGSARLKSEEHTSELQSLMRISYAVFCLKKKNTTHIQHYK